MMRVCLIVAVKTYNSDVALCVIPWIVVYVVQVLTPSTTDTTTVGIFVQQAMLRALGYFNSLRHVKIMRIMFAQ
jgi:hypothetical protein